MLFVQGDTEREDSRVAVVLDPIEGDRGASKLKFSSNMVLSGGEAMVLDEDISESVEISSTCH